MVPQTPNHGQVAMPPGTMHAETPLKHQHGVHTPSTEHNSWKEGGGWHLQASARGKRRPCPPLHFAKPYETHAAGMVVSEQAGTQPGVSQVHVHINK